MNETYVEYLKRVGGDYKASDPESATADDYFESADRLLKVEEAITALTSGPKFAGRAKILSLLRKAVD